MYRKYFVHPFPQNFGLIEESADPYTFLAVYCNCKTPFSGTTYAWIVYDACLYMASISFTFSTFPFKKKNH